MGLLEQKASAGRTAACSFPPRCRAERSLKGGRAEQAGIKCQISQTVFTAFR
ncbi:MAG: hypothetical protein ACLT98_08640 [Eggerthellaceae bacterium]